MTLTYDAPEAGSCEYENTSSRYYMCATIVGNVITG